MILEHTYSDALSELSTPWAAAPAPDPRLLVLNEPLAAELGLDPEALAAPEGVRWLAGEAEGTVAQAYSGHQFGAFSPRLGDGRALLLGELAGRDLHLKGSGRTPFARGGDGKAAVGPMLREYVVSEAMHALGIPTTRALAVVATGENVMRETVLPGAILVRVAASHLRVGTFQYAAVHEDTGVLQRLVDYAIARHHPDAEGPLGLLEAVVEAQARLIAQWMCVGFVHGVMNTDNMTISGETIDYGPCAFMEAFDPGTVFSSIDHQGRYAFGAQPQIAQWNLARLADTLLPLMGEREAAVQAATTAIKSFSQRFDAHIGRGLGAKLGVEEPGLADELLTLMRDRGADFTATFRGLADDVVPAGFEDWASRWRAVRGPADLRRVNPVYIPRNHLVEEALAAATAGDLAPLEFLVDAVTRPFDERDGWEAFAGPAPDDFARTFQTFCGT